MKEDVRDRKRYEDAKTRFDLSGTDVLHQVDRREGELINKGKQVPNKQYRVSGYMNSNQMNGVMAGHEKATGDIDPKAAIHGTGLIAPKDTWQPKAYKKHANAGNQRFYVD